MRHRGIHANEFEILFFNFSFSSLLFYFIIYLFLEKGIFN